MADHLDVPGLIDLEGHLIGPPNMDPRVDITDVYAFRKVKTDSENEDDSRSKLETDSENEDDSRSVLMLNVNPLTLSTAFNPDAIYEILVDTNGDATPDIAFKTRFSAVATDGSQTASVVRAVGGSEYA